MAPAVVKTASIMLDPHSSGTDCLKGTSVGSDGTRNGSDVTSDGSRGRRAADVEVESAASGVIGPPIYWLNRSFETLERSCFHMLFLFE